MYLSLTRKAAEPGPGFFALPRAVGPSLPPSTHLDEDTSSVRAHGSPVRSLMGVERRCPSGCLAPGAARRTKTLFACWNWLQQSNAKNFPWLVCAAQSTRKESRGPVRPWPRCSSPISVLGCKPEFAPSRQTVRYTGPLLFRLDKAMCYAQGNHDVRCKLTAVFNVEPSFHEPGRRPTLQARSPTNMGLRLHDTAVGRCPPHGPWSLPSSPTSSDHVRGLSRARASDAATGTGAGKELPQASHSVHNTTPASAEQKM